MKGLCLGTCGRLLMPWNWPGPNSDTHARHMTRGQCRRCSDWSYRNGSSLDFPRRTRRAVDVVEDYMIFARRGLGDDEIAEKLGIKKASMERALLRAGTSRTALRELIAAEQLTSRARTGLLIS